MLLLCIRRQICRLAHWSFKVANITARVLNETGEIAILARVFQQIHQSLVVFFELGNLYHVGAWGSTFFLEVQLLYFVFFALKLLGNELDLSRLCLNLFLQNRCPVSVLLVCLLQSHQAFFLKL